MNVIKFEHLFPSHILKINFTQVYKHIIKDNIKVIRQILSTLNHHDQKIFQLYKEHTGIHIGIGVARGGHGRAYALPSLNFALPSKPSFY